MATVVDAEVRSGLSPRPAVPISSRNFLLAVIAVGIVFLASVAPRVGLEPGDSHDGRNTGLWTVGARSLLENGPIESRLGAWAPERGVYANHPPGVTLETAAFLATTGTSPWSRKAPAYLSSLAAIGLAAVLLRRLGFSRAAAVGGVALMTATPMFLVFGASPNMEAVSLPWVMLVLAAWAAPERPGSPAMAATGVCGCVWMFHGSLLLAFGLGVISLVRLVRRRPSAVDRPTAGWALGAALALGAWFVWANGGLGDLLGKGGERSSLGDVGFSAWAQRQLEYAADGFGPLLLVASTLGLVVALRAASGSRRLVIGFAASLPVAYLALTMNGAWHHEYWNYLVLVPVAIGAASVIDATLAKVSGLSRAVVGLAVVALVITGLSARIPAHYLFTDGAGAAVLLEAESLPVEQETALTYPAIVNPQAWVQWITRRPTENLLGPVPLAEWAAANPDDVVLVDRDGVEFLHGDEMWAGVVAQAGDRVRGDYALVEVADLDEIAAVHGLRSGLSRSVLEKLLIDGA